VFPVPQKLCFGPLELAPAVTLAPMAGVTDTVFRRFIRNLGGCGLIMTEFTSSHGIIADDKRRKGGKKPHRRTNFNYLYFEPDEHPIVAQLFGSDPKILADAARVVEDLGFDGVDMNFGCPVKKVVKCNGGSGLLRDLPLIREILTAVRQAVTIPFTCKFRTGWDDNEIVCCELAKSPNRRASRGLRCTDARARRVTRATPTGIGSPGSSNRFRSPWWATATSFHPRTPCECSSIPAATGS
jgi:tRNA-dihydrouridine synthase B